MSKQIRQKLKFTGRVQGVGFRFTASHIANQLGLTGWVYNEWDGSVVMEVQGQEHLIDQMIQIIDRGVFIQIDNIQRENILLKDHETNFQVKDDY